MLNSMKTDVLEKDKNSAANAAEVMGKTAQPHDQAWARSEPTKAGTASCIGSDMSIVGNVECKGPAQVFGRIEGEKVLRETGVWLWVVGLNPEVLAVVRRSSLGETLGRERMHFTLEGAIDKYLAMTSATGVNV